MSAASPSKHSDFCCQIQIILCFPRSKCRLSTPNVWFLPSHFLAAFSFPPAAFWWTVVVHWRRSFSVVAVLRPRGSSLILRLAPVLMCYSVFCALVLGRFIFRVGFFSLAAPVIFRVHLGGVAQWCEWQGTAASGRRDRHEQCWRWKQGSPNRWESVRLPVKPVWLGSGLGRYQTGLNSNLNFKKWNFLKKILKIFQGATNLMVSNFF